jgi:hypothetical protein
MVLRRHTGSVPINLTAVDPSSPKPGVKSWTKQVVGTDEMHPSPPYTLSAENVKSSSSPQRFRLNDGKKGF